MGKKRGYLIGRFVYLFALLVLFGFKLFEIIDNNVSMIALILILIGSVLMGLYEQSVEEIKNETSNRS